MSRLHLAGLALLGCVPTLPGSAVPDASASVQSSSSEVRARLAELPPLYFYRWRGDVIWPTPRDVWAVWEGPPAWPNGILVGEGRSGPPPQMGQRLAVLHEDGRTTTVVVTDQHCPPTRVGCLSCDSRWAAHLAGPPIDPNTVLAVVGPLEGDAFEFSLLPDEPLPRVVVTRDGVTLTEDRGHCPDSPISRRGCVSSTAFVLGDHVRVLANVPAPRPSGLQLFVPLTWPGSTILHYDGPIGGDDQIVIGAVSSLPMVPVDDASYWLIGPAGVVGSVRFAPPYPEAYCSFMSNPCWSTQVTDPPASTAEVWLAVGPIADVSVGAEAITQAHRSGDFEHFELQIGAPGQPWLSERSRSFACLSDDWQWGRMHGWCAETVVEGEGATTRRVSFTLDMPHARHESICVESLASR